MSTLRLEGQPADRFSIVVVLLFSFLVEIIHRADQRNTTARVQIRPEIQKRNMCRLPVVYKKTSGYEIAVS